MESANDPKKFSILGNYDNKIFWPVAILYGCIIAYAIIDPSGAGATFSSIQRFIIAHFSWLILLTGASAIFFSVWMACSSRFATVKLGAADEKPEFSFFAWVAMLFCAALGTGFVIFGAAEPLYHLFTAPTVMDAGSAGAVRGVPEAIRLSVVNWGLFGWPLFAVGGWAIGYAAYCHNKPLRYTRNAGAASLRHPGLLFFILFIVVIHYRVICVNYIIIRRTLLAACVCGSRRVSTCAAHSRCACCLCSLCLFIEFRRDNVEFFSQSFCLFLNLINRTVVQNSLKLVFCVGNLSLFVFGNLSFEFLQRFFCLID